MKPDTGFQIENWGLKGSFRTVQRYLKNDLGAKIYKSPKKSLKFAPKQTDWTTEDWKRVERSDCPKMSWIEGVGDEVVLVLAALVLVLILLIAWLSTSARDPDFNVVNVILGEIGRITSDRRNEAAPPDQPNSREGTPANQSQGNIQRPGLLPDVSNGRQSSLSSLPHSDWSCQENTSSSRDEHSLLAETSQIDPAVPGSHPTVIGPVDSDVSIRSSPGPDVLPTTSGSGSCDDGVFHTSDRAALGERTPVAPSATGDLSSATPIDHITPPESSLAQGQGECTILPGSQVESEATSIRLRPKADMPTRPSPYEPSYHTESVPSVESAVRDAIRVRLKFFNDTQKVADAYLEETLGDFKRRYFENELQSNKFVRLIYNGRLLSQDSETLGNYGLSNNCVLHCLVSQGQSNTSAAPNAQRDTLHVRQEDLDLDLGNFMLPIFAVILSIIWYCWFEFGQFFNAPSTIALIGLTGILIISVVAVYGPHHFNHDLLGHHHENQQPNNAQPAR
ncbi:unnamed protein product [Darwinula stevensoni]|uniref:Ubiquitin-like domain-containing protein n=1 Tax=Darwinula stevensoni TaxID=69355 RepID=A0A7R8X774_9CRUS|nr:unnamed protein product [Darwinula stevensoni]CAG0886558.1 unnamed protein product [Darwinula stevensoni]